jgi:hypothetical protein
VRIFLRVRISKGSLKRRERGKILKNVLTYIVFFLHNSIAIIHREYEMTPRLRNPFTLGIVQKEDF